MLPSYCTAQMWLFPDAPRFQVKNLEAACDACTACCRAAPRGTYHLACVLAIISIAAIPIAPPLGKGPDLMIGNRHQSEIYQGTIECHDLHGVGHGFYHFNRRMTQVNLKQVNQCACEDQPMYCFHRKLLDLDCPFLSVNIHDL